MIILPILFVGIIILAGWGLTRPRETEADRLARRDRWVHSRGWSVVDGPLSRMDVLKPFSKAGRRMIYELAHEDFNRDHPWVLFQVLIIPMPVFLNMFGGRGERWLVRQLPSLDPAAADVIGFLFLVLISAATILGFHALVFLRVRRRIAPVIHREQLRPPDATLYRAV